MREEILLFVRWKSRKVNLREYLDFSKIILKELQTLHPLFENLCSWGFSADAWHCFDKNITDFDKILLEQLKDNQLAFINQNNDDKELHYDSYSPIGFSNSYSNTKKESDGKITIDIHDGYYRDQEQTGFINFKFPRVGYDEFYEERFCYDLLLKLITISNAQYAVILTRPLRKHVKRIDDEFWIGWYNYFSKKDILEHLPKSNPLLKHLPSRGAFFSIDSKNPLEMGDKEIAIAQEIKHSLTDSGLLNEYYQRV